MRRGGACRRWRRILLSRISTSKALAVCGSALVGGSYGGSRSQEGQALVWDLETLRPLHTLRQPAGDDVESLVGSQVVVWGRRVAGGGGA